MRYCKQLFTSPPFCHVGLVSEWRIQKTSNSKSPTPQRKQQQTLTHTLLTLQTICPPRTSMVGMASLPWPPNQRKTTLAVLSKGQDSGPKFQGHLPSQCPRQALGVSGRDSCQPQGCWALHCPSQENLASSAFVPPLET